MLAQKRGAAALPEHTSGGAKFAHQSSHAVPALTAANTNQQRMHARSAYRLSPNRRPSRKRRISCLRRQSSSSLFEGSRFRQGAAAGAGHLQQTAHLHHGVTAAWFASSSLYAAWNPSGSIGRRLFQEGKVLLQPPVLMGESSILPGRPPDKLSSPPLASVRRRPLAC